MKNKKLQIPHTFVILFIIILAVAAMTYIIPAGQFERVVDETTQIVTIDPSSYKSVEQTPIGVFKIFVSIQRGFVESGSVIFLIIFAYFCVYTVTKTGALNGFIKKLLQITHGKENYMIPIFMMIFALAGSTYGEWDTIFALIPVFVGLAIAIGYDALVGLSMSGMAVAIGFASATTNPFTISIAQAIGGLPLFSGLLFRCVIFIIFISVGIWWTMRYAKKIKLDPTKSLVRDVNFDKLAIDRKDIDNSEFTTKHKIILLILVGTIGAIVYGTLNWGWYLDEMSAAFLLSGIVASLVWGFKSNEMVENMIDAFSGMAVGIVVVGLSRTMLVLIQDANIIDTIIYYMYLPLRNLPSWIAAEGMLVVQNVLNLFIPSGSGQATAAMPIMVALSDLVDVNRQVAVLAYQLGDGFSNLIWPTGGIVVMCGIAKIPLDRWYKFFMPLFAIFLVLESVVIAVATFIDYGPF